MTVSTGLTIGALSEQSGVNIETIRYYETIGVMPTPARSGGGYRIYGPDEVKRLHFVRRGRELGFSLDDLRGLLRLVDGHRFTCAQVRMLTVDHLAEVRSKITDLRRIERVMADMVAQCTGNRVPDCPIIDALFAARPSPEGGRDRQSRPKKGRIPQSDPHQPTSTDDRPKPSR
jgi:MerR family mercuric resistance operon transcriptional regulator